MKRKSSKEYCFQEKLSKIRRIENKRKLDGKPFPTKNK